MNSGRSGKLLTGPRPQGGSDGTSADERSAGKGRILGSWERVDLVHRLSLSGKAAEKAVKAAEKALLIALAKHEDRRDGFAWASLRTLARETGFVERTMRTALAKLRRCGFVVVHSRPRQKTRVNVVWEKILSSTLDDEVSREQPTAAPIAADEALHEQPTAAPIPPICGTHSTNLRQMRRETAAAVAYKGLRRVGTEKKGSSGEQATDDDFLRMLLKRCSLVDPQATERSIAWAWNLVASRARTKPKDPHAYFFKAVPLVFEELDQEVENWLAQAAEKRLTTSQPPQGGDLVEQLKQMVAEHELPYTTALVYRAIDIAERHLEEERGRRSESTVGRRGGRD